MGARAQDILGSPDCSSNHRSSGHFKRTCWAEIEEDLREDFSCMLLTQTVILSPPGILTNYLQWPRLHER